MTMPAADVTAVDAEPARLWQSLPSSLASLLRPEIGDLADEIISEIQRKIPEYARPLDANYVRSIRRGVEEALHQFVDRIAHPTAIQQRCAEVHRTLGHNEMRDGRSLDSLQRAYRLGARLAWRRIMTMAARVPVSHETQLLLGEAIIAHIDELVALAVEGYAQAEARATGALARRRQRLLDMLVADPPVSQVALLEAARAAKWELPSRVVVAALDPCASRRFERTSLARWQALVDLERNDPYVLVPADTGEHVDIDWGRTCLDWRVAVSAPVALADAVHALRWMRRVLALVRRGILPDQPVTYGDDHLSSILLLGDEALVSELVQRRLAPLIELTPKERVRLGQTLLSWLQNRGGAPEIAADLHIHPQTVRRRLRRLERLFGPDLHDPDARFNLELALRAAALVLPLADRDRAEHQRLPG